jgi:hypothetical protein
MNLVEVWFGIIERQAIRRGVFKSVEDLNTKIRAFIEGWNDRSHPFVWTKTAQEILKAPTVQQLQIRATRSPRLQVIRAPGTLSKWLVARWPTETAQRSRCSLS